MKFRLIVAAAIAGALTLLSSGAAHAGYPDPTITITIGDADMIGGTKFTYTADAGPVDCNWTITYSEAVNGPDVQTGSGTSLQGTYDTKVVSSVFRSPIKAVCEYDDGQVASSGDATTAPAFFSTGSGSATVQAVIQEASASATITLRPLGSEAGDGDALPDTGGSNLSLILLGVGLLLLGGGVTYLARRRSSSH